MHQLPGGVTVTVTLVDSIHNFSNFNLSMCSDVKGNPIAGEDESLASKL